MLISSRVPGFCAQSTAASPHMQMHPLTANGSGVQGLAIPLRGPPHGAVRGSLPQRIWWRIVLPRKLRVWLSYPFIYDHIDLPHS